MQFRWRNLLGGIAILAFLAAYALAAIVVSDLVPDHWLAELIYFAIVGTVWVLPLVPLLAWMGKDDHSHE